MVSPSAIVNGPLDGPVGMEGGAVFDAGALLWSTCTTPPPADTVMAAAPLNVGLSTLVAVTVAVPVKAGPEMNSPVGLTLPALPGLKDQFTRWSKSPVPCTVARR